MLVVETIARIRRAFFKQGKPIKAICRELGVSRKVVRKVIRSAATEFRYVREDQPLPKIGRWRDTLEQLLSDNEAKSSRERLTLIRVFDELRGRGYEGGYDAVRRYVRRWAKERGHSTATAGRFKSRDDDLLPSRARAASATPTGSVGASATAKPRRSKGSLLNCRSRMFEGRTAIERSPVSLGGITIADVTIDATHASKAITDTAALNGGSLQVHDLVTINVMASTWVTSTHKTSSSTSRLRERAGSLRRDPEAPAHKSSVC